MKKSKSPVAPLLADCLSLLGIALALSGLGCARYGNLGPGHGGVLADDADRLPPGDMAGPGLQAVVATGLTAKGSWGRLPIALYQPAGQRGPLPAVVFLPGRVAPESQYESYARALASRGFAVAVRGWYSPFWSDRELADDAVHVADWLVERGLADPSRMGAAGHSMGAKDAILAAVEDRRFRAVVAIDPDDNGSFSVVRGPLADLEAPLLLIGAELAWKASSVCAPRETNYERFFERAPSGTVELTLMGADHVQVMDDAEGIGYGICRSGTADAFSVRTAARRATVGFFVEHLLGGEGSLQSAAGGEEARIRVKGAPASAARAFPSSG
ncbi:MAG TPA: prolyl oligopeptidase family serine peptidase [Polyangiaceae bacterium]|nr:prolyl oligopeptidase family serine peptidase [Polyangiaceae bacterium]